MPICSARKRGNYDAQNEAPTGAQSSNGENYDGGFLAATGCHFRFSVLRYRKMASGCHLEWSGCHDSPDSRQGLCSNLWLCCAYPRDMRGIRPRA